MVKENIVILAAGHSKRPGEPCSLWSFGNGRSILDWQMYVFEKAFPNAEINIAVGYDYQKIMASHPDKTFSHVIDWENGSALNSFLSAVRNYSSTTLVTYGDTVFHHETLAEFSRKTGDVVIAVDGVWKQRFLGRSQEDIALAETLTFLSRGEIEYTGLAKFSPKLMEWISVHRNSYHPNSNFVDLLKDISNANFKITTYDVAGKWAEMNEQNDLVHFILGSKAETLNRIQPLLKKSKVCDQITCTWHDWTDDLCHVIKNIQSQFQGQNLIVRSSSVEEDGWDTSNAGAFESVLNVDCNDSDALTKAIEGVFSSYDNITPNVQVLIQPFVCDVVMSGVVFTCDLITGAPYYIINYDDVSGRTDSITSGKASHLRTVIVFHHDISAALAIDPRLGKVIEAAQELENLLGYSKLDIEFAIDIKEQCFTFQIRPITVSHEAYQLDNEQLLLHLKTAQQQFRDWQKKAARNMLGDYTVFSGMTDWNPAEIIGTRPNALAVSLYNHVITEEIWAKQRAEFGYRDIRPAPLVHNFCAQPYVDCRVSINSFIPSGITGNCSQRLVIAYLDLLKDNPCLHDKLELDVVFTIWTPTFIDDAKERFKNSDVSTKDIAELEQALKKITADALVRLDKDISSITVLSKRFNLLMASELEPVDKIYQLVEDCRTFGTLAFAHAARAGFVAVTLLKSLVKLGSLSQERMLQFQASVSTVASDFQNALSTPRLNIDKLTRQFGHLRPGTYDVNQLAYWEKPEFYFVRNKRSDHIDSTSKNNFAFTNKERLSLQHILDQLPIDIEVDSLIQYLRKAIQAREGTKFEFTRNLSAALDIMIKYGTGVLGLKREDIGYFTFDDIRNLRTGQLNEKLIQDFIILRKTDFSEKHLAKLPSFLCSEKDFFAFEQTKSEANFITRYSIVADLAFIKGDSNCDIDGKIIAIPNADPGFDWIFSHNIAGLITQYGGANSHMAIRCAELGIPAAIGIGDKLYESLHERRLLLDCQKGFLEYV